MNQSLILWIIMKYKSLRVLSVGLCEYQRTCVGSTCEHHDTSTAGQSQALANPYYIICILLGTPPNSGSWSRMHQRWWWCSLLLDRFLGSCYVPLGSHDVECVWISECVPSFLQHSIANEWATLISQANEPCIVNRILQVGQWHSVFFALLWASAASIFRLSQRSKAWDSIACISASRCNIK